jgi:hypothetical protein
MYEISFQATVSQKKNNGPMLADIMDINMILLLRK